MRRKWVLPLLAVVSVAGYIGVRWHFNVPRAVFDHIEHNFGILPENEDVEHRFTLTNFGRETLLIHGVRSTCGCSKATITRDSLPPGESANVIVSFHVQPGDVRPHAEIFVFTNDAEHELTTLRVDACIPTPFEMSPTALEFGAIPAGEERQIGSTIFSHDASAVSASVIDAATSTPIQASIAPITTGQCRLLVKLASDCPCGPLTARVLIRYSVAGEDRPREKIVEVRGRVVGAVAADPAEVVLAPKWRSSLTSIIPVSGKLPGKPIVSAVSPGLQAVVIAEIVAHEDAFALKLSAKSANTNSVKGVVEIAFRGSTVRLRVPVKVLSPTTED